MMNVKKEHFLEEFYSLIEELHEEQTLIVVEGKNDKKALKYFGLENIVTLATPLYKIIEMIRDKEIVVLTDFDKKGKELYRKIKSLCSQRGIKINHKLRTLLRKETSLSHIEGLATYIQNLDKLK